MMEVFILFKKKSCKKVNKPIKKRENIIKSLFYVNGKFSFLALLKNIAIPLGGGIVIALITRDSMEKYTQLNKSILTPPAIVFPIVWSILYILMGIAAYRIYMNNKDGKTDYDGYFYYLVQLLINFLWSIVFFNLRLYGISFFLIIILLILIIITTIKFFKVDNISGVAMIPYIIWVGFASYLTFYIWVFNEM